MTDTRTAPPKAERRPRASIDPRIRARRIEVQRTEGRRRLHRLSLVGGAVAIVVGLVWLTTTPLLDVDAIRVQGADHTGQQAVLDALHIERGDALLTADISGASRSLLRLPWVATAKVRRSWPGTVAVSIVERRPVAAVAAKKGGWVLVDVGGRQLDVSREPAVELVRVAGLPLVPAPGVLAGPAYDGALALAAEIPTSLRASISSVWPKRDGSVDAIAVLPGGHQATVRLGTAEVSPKHANFIQADAGGSADDVAALIAEVQRRVRDAFGVELHPELRMIGFE